MASITLENQTLRLTILPAMGGGLTRFDTRLQGSDWQAVFRRSPPNPTDPNQLAFYPLLPWSNRVTPEFEWAGQRHQLACNRVGEQFPIHGDAWLSSWSLQEVQGQTATLLLRSRAIPPFDYEARLIYALTADTLNITIELTHLGEQAMVYGAGFHPWIHRVPGTKLVTTYQGRWIENPETRLPIQRIANLASSKVNQLPREPINAVFDGWCANATVSWPDTGLSMTVRSSPWLKFFVLYSTGQDADFFCFEPVSHLINAHAMQKPTTHGLRVLQQGESLRAVTAFQLQGPTERWTTTKPPTCGG